MIKEWYLSNYQTWFPYCWKQPAPVKAPLLSPQASLHSPVCASTSATLSRPWTSFGGWWVLNCSPTYTCPSAGLWPRLVSLIRSRWPVASCSYSQLVLLIVNYIMSLLLLFPCPRDTTEEAHFIYHCVCILQEPVFGEGCGDKQRDKTIIYVFVGIDLNLMNVHPCSGFRVFSGKFISFKMHLLFILRLLDVGPPWQYNSISSCIQKKHLVMRTMHSMH